MARPNIPLLKRLRTRFLRMRHPKHFDMGTWGDKGECGTVACIAGHTLLLQGYKLKLYQGGYHYFAPGANRPIKHPAPVARRELGLSSSVTEDLFYSGSTETPKTAAARIQELIELAEVKYGLPDPPESK